eukprot:TRINITY_DN4883_c0_g4_i1.p1 TRINITY_DN4883_c0_g4~~TRINITY_DN4883_c0_g4_i1.p1  ORF type:complete len:205 (+),score=54.05 TRINITY_DN4883_c0_g4_i1:136-750(+)
MIKCGCCIFDACLTKKPQNLRAKAPLQLCSRYFTKAEFRVQDWWVCEMCFGERQMGVCGTCMVVCHQNHPVKKGKRSKFYCDCCDRPGGCKCQSITVDPPNSKRRVRHTPSLSSSDQNAGGSNNNDALGSSNTASSSSSMFGSQSSNSDDDLCIICMDGPKEAVFFRCGHVATCMECASHLLQRGDGCPFCRQQIVDIVRGYKV